MPNSVSQNAWPQWSVIIRFIENTAWHFCSKDFFVFFCVWLHWLHLWQMPHTHAVFTRESLQIHKIYVYVFSAFKYVAVTHVTYQIVSQAPTFQWTALLGFSQYAAFRNRTECMGYLCMWFIFDVEKWFEVPSLSRHRFNHAKQWSVSVQCQQWQFHVIRRKRKIRRVFILWCPFECSS